MNDSRLPQGLAAGLGALVGVVTALAMFRLVGGLFDGPMTPFALAFTLVPTLAWVVYATWRARRGRLTRRRGLAVAVLGLGGLAATWLFTIGPVIALALSLAGFAVIWLSDLPVRRREGEARFVRVEELGSDGD